MELDIFEGIAPEFEFVWYLSFVADPVIKVLYKNKEKNKEKPVGIKNKKMMYVVVSLDFRKDLITWEGKKDFFSFEIVNYNERKGIWREYERIDRQSRRITEKMKVQDKAYELYKEIWWDCIAILRGHDKGINYTHFAKHQALKEKTAEFKKALFEKLYKDIRINSMTKKFIK